MLSIQGERSKGQDVRTTNITACISIANIVKTSLGPVGLDKMLVDQVGDVTVTNDGATILSLLEIEHPAAKVLAELATQQDQEVGDGTTSVVIIAAELLKRANALVQQGIHPTSVISGFRMSVREACKYIRDKMAVPVDKLGREVLVNAAKTSLSSKILGGTNVDYFANMAVDTVLAVKRSPKFDEESGDLYPLKSIHVLKALGKSVRESELLQGYAIPYTKPSLQMPTRIIHAKIACVDFDLRKTKLKMGIQVLVNDPEELQKMSEAELNITRNRIQAILKAGANVVLTTKGIDDSSLKYFVEAGALAARRVAFHDLKRIARATGASIQTTMADLNGEESFEPSFLGSAEEVYEERVQNDILLNIKGCKNAQASTVLLRGPNEYMCEEMHRSFHDAVCVVKRTLESNKVVPGGGCVEAALSIHLEKFAEMIGSREQLAIAEFAEALLVIPKTLAMNAAKDATDLIAKLRAVHNAAQKGDEDPQKSEVYAKCGLDLENGKIRDNLTAGVIEPAISKIKSLQFATEACLTILRIDDMITLDKKENTGEVEEDY